MTYVYDHNLITQATVEIGSRRLNKFRVSVTGKDDEGQSFDISAPLPFEGVHVSASDRDSAAIIKARLSEVLDISNLSASRFTLDGNKYNSGVEMATMSFKPRT
ncbi:MAG: hypothetical protein HQ526_08015 [Actinobacteria bacterium]|nr:hypothetical protein [Actinomycetota bacterium]